MKGRHGDKPSTAGEDGLIMTDSLEEQLVAKLKTNDAGLDQKYWSSGEWLLERAAGKSNKEAVLCHRGELASVLLPTFTDVYSEQDSGNQTSSKHQDQLTTVILRIVLLLF